MKTFVTLFEKTENVHLIKDVGQIPYLMHRYFGYQASIVSYRNCARYEYLDNEVVGLGMHFVPKVRVAMFPFSMLFFLWRHAKDIDVLHLFHHREKSYILGLAYKYFNPKGVLYLKSDMAFDSMVEFDGFVPQRKRLHYWFRRKLFRPFMAAVDVISVETAPAKDFACKRFPEFAQKFICLSNGTNLERMYGLVPPLPASGKEPIILSVGRIGALEKRNEMLLEAAERVELGEWKVVFVGPVEPAFAAKLESLYGRRPDLRDRVICTGEIRDRKTLYEWYARSRIFCLTSRAESFGIVLIEAMAYGCDVVTTPVSSARVITNDEKLGYIVADQEELCALLRRAIIDGLPNRHDAIIASVKERYSWREQLDKLQNRIVKVTTEIHPA